MMSETQVSNHYDVDDKDEVALDILDNISEQDGLIGDGEKETSSDYTQTSSTASNSTTYPNDHYPYDPHHDELFCIPELPCSSTYTKVGKLYKCKTDHGVCGGNTMYIGACWPMMLLTQGLIWGITLMVLYVYGSYVHWLVVVIGATTCWSRRTLCVKHLVVILELYNEETLRLIHHGVGANVQRHTIHQVKGLHIVMSHKSWCQSTITFVHGQGQLLLVET